LLNQREKENTKNIKLYLERMQQQIMKNEESMFESQVGEMGYRTGANFGQKYQINQAIQEEDE
jgi:hypothetical protein